MDNITDVDSTASTGSPYFEVPWICTVSDPSDVCRAHFGMPSTDLLYFTSDDDSHWLSTSELEQFMAKKRFLEGNGIRPVHPFDFYRDVFPAGSFERLGHQEDCKPNGIAQIIRKDDDKRSKAVIITDGLEQLESCVLYNDFVITSPISYFGRSRKSKNASMLHALTLDIDYVEEQHIEHMLEHFGEEVHYAVIPTPTYLINSGHGVHLYYVFDKPIPLYKQNQVNLLGLKKYLIDLIWTKYNSSQPSKKECLSLFQGFRMVGSKSKLGACRVTAYKMNNHKCTFDWLAGFDRALKPKFEHFITYGKTGLSLKEAKEKYPDWYERRVVKGEPKQIANWRPNRRLYDWWFNRAIKEIEEGHRYFGVMTLAIFAAKCGISKEELESDALELQEEFETKGKEPFTVEDMKSALAAYKEEYRTFTRQAIERITGLEIPANKRNGLKQDKHLYLARRRKEDMKELGIEFKFPEGRPKGSGTKKDLILDYKEEHPKATQREIASALNVSPTTVNKWVKAARENA